MTRFQFYNDDDIHSSLHVTRRVVPLEPHHLNPLIVPDRAWEGAVAGAYPTVVFDRKQRLFKCWYESRAEQGRGTRSTCFICYAESSDGISWDKPDLGVVSFRGSKRNNIVLRCNRRKSPSVGANVVFRPRAAVPYRLIYWDDGPSGKQGVCVAGSPDGIHWRPDPKNPVLQSPMDRMASSNDDVVTASWDSARKRHVAWYRTITTENLDATRRQREIPGGFFERIICQTRSDDGVHWSAPRRILQSGLDDAPDDQLYGLSGMYQPDGSAIGFLFVSHWNSGRMDIELAWSGDGDNWERVCVGQPIIANGAKGTWNYGFMHAAASPFLVSDALHVYVAASSRLHHPLDDKETPRVYSTGLAIGRRARLVAVHAPGTSARVMLRKTIVDGTRLAVNADAGRGAVRVGLRDDDFRFYKGFGLESCVPLTEDAVEQEVRWKGNAGLDRLRGKPVYIQVEMNQADLFGVGTRTDG